VPALADDFNLLDPIVIVVLCTTSALAVSGARTINSIAFVVGIAIIAFLLAAGFLAL
jgi:APA family basic amino acid/polyamine antiporter/cationic amino acid transporter 4